LLLVSYILFTKNLKIIKNIMICCYKKCHTYGPSWYKKINANSLQLSKIGRFFVRDPNTGIPTAPIITSSDSYTGTTVERYRIIH
jgi:hypothetical protein